MSRRIDPTNTRKQSSQRASVRPGRSVNDKKRTLWGWASILKRNWASAFLVAIWIEWTPWLQRKQSTPETIKELSIQYKIYWFTLSKKTLYLKIGVFQAATEDGWRIVEWRRTLWTGAKYQLRQQLIQERSAAGIIVRQQRLQFGAIRSGLTMWSFEIPIWKKKLSTTYVYNTRNTRIPPCGWSAWF